MIGAEYIKGGLMIHLVPMTEEQFAGYLRTAVQDYAQAHIKAGDCDPAEALPKAQAEFKELLPEGLQTKNHHLCMCHEDVLGEDIGMIWFSIKDALPVKPAYLFDFMIREELRGKGYGRKALARFEQMAYEMGIGKVSLNVFGWNHAARALYEKMGYQITGIGMTKSLR